LEPYSLNIVSFLELIYTAACIDKLLFTGEERMALIADIDLQRFYVFSSACRESSTASAHNRYLVVFGMYFGLHSYHLA